MNFKTEYLWWFCFGWITHTFASLYHTWYSIGLVYVIGLIVATFTIPLFIKFLTRKAAGDGQKR